MNIHISEGSHYTLKHWCQEGREGEAGWLAGHAECRWKSRKVVPDRTRFKSTSIATLGLSASFKSRSNMLTILQMQRNQYCEVSGQITEIQTCAHQMLTRGVLENRVNCHCQLIVSVSHCVIPSTFPRIKNQEFFHGEVILKIIDLSQLVLWEF